MASKLGLSVHTINERLRDTRRKLSVSSSKAAAWTIGGLAMIAALFATRALSPSQPVATPAQAASAPVPVAESDSSRAARQWLTLVDARNWQAAQPRS